MQYCARFIDRRFRDYYLHGDVLAEAQIAVARAYGTDHVTCMGEPWTESDSFGMRFEYPEDGVGIPQGFFLQSRDDVRKLRVVDPATAPRMQERVACLRKLVKDVGDTQCVVGWVEGPIAEYSDLRDVQTAMMDLLDDPAMFHEAAEVIVANALSFAKAQAAEGVDVIGVGDAAASLIGPELYAEHVLPWEQKLIAGLHDLGVFVKLHICGNIAKILPLMAKSGADIIDVDWMVPLADARRMVGNRITLAGNFDPSAVLLQGTPDRVADAARRCIADAGDRFILQPGCEVPPATPEANLMAFCPAGNATILHR